MKPRGVGKGLAGRALCDVSGTGLVVVFATGRAPGLVGCSARCEEAGPGWVVVFPTCRVGTIGVACRQRCQEACWAGSVVVFAAGRAQTEAVAVQALRDEAAGVGSVCM